MELEIAPFDPAEFLKDPEAIADYLTAALEDPDPRTFLLAIQHAARAHGMSRLARDSGLGRESLYKALSPSAKPRFDTILKVARAMGLRLEAHPIPTL